MHSLLEGEDVVISDSLVIYLARPVGQWWCLRRGPTLVTDSLVYGGGEGLVRGCFRDLVIKGVISDLILMLIFSVLSRNASQLSPVLL